MSVLRTAFVGDSYGERESQNSGHNNGTRSLPEGIDRTKYVYWLIFFWFFTVVRRRFFQSYSNEEPDLFKFVSSWNILEIISWFYIFKLVPWRATGPKIKLYEAIILLVYLTIVLVYYDPMGFIFLLPLLIYLGVRFGSNKDFKASITCLILATSLPFFSAEPFLVLHETMARIDAIVVVYLLGLAGHSVSAAQTVVIAPGGNHGIDIFVSCASTFNLASVVGTFVIILMGRRGGLRLSDASWLLILVLGVFGINWLRLSAMALTRSGYEYWHTGDGASIVSLADALMVLLASSAAIWTPRRNNMLGR